MSDRSEAWEARRRAWRVERLTPSLERLPERRARFTTLGDLPIDGLYGAWDWDAPSDGEPAGPGGPTAVDHHGDPLREGTGRYADMDPLRDVGLPGEPPFTRGIHPTGYRSRPWTMRMFAGFGSAEDTNVRFRQLLDAGQTGLSIAYDMPTLYGYDTDDPEAEGEFGTCGVAVSSLADMELLLDGLPLDRVSTSMTINAPAAPIWAMYIAAAEKQGVPRAALEGTTQNDILKEYVAQKEFLYPPEPSMRLVVDTIEFGSRELPRWNTVSISGYHIREAGSTAVQELAFTIADGMAYVEACMARGLRVDEFAPRLSFFFNSHSDFFEEIAKFRASRRIWWKLMSERYRAENERSTWMRFHTQTAGVSLTPQQPLNNLTRVATQALAAILGGTQSLHTDAYDEALAVPTAEAALLALRQQQILAEETGVASTVDPLGGSWFVEALTNRVERDVWRYLDEIDRRGGMVAAIAEGYPQREIADAAYRFQREFDEGERVIVGVNRFVNDEPVTVPVLAVPEGSFERHMARLERTRAERDAEAVGAALDGLREAAAKPGSSANNLMPHFLRCAERYVTLGEQCRALREVFGEYREPVSVSTGPGYDARMYLDALSFLEDERDGFRAYEALDALTDEELDRPVEAAGGWSGRDLMGHIVLWQEAALTTAKELAVNETSPTKDWLDAEWDKPGVGDRMNEDGLERFRALPMAEVRRLFHETAGELRGYLTVVPESRWIKHTDHQNFFFGETLEHYEDHEADLRAILAAAGR